MLAAVAEGEVCVAGATAEASYIERRNIIIFVCVNMKKKSPDSPYKMSKSKQPRHKSCGGFRRKYLMTRIQTNK